MEDIREVAIQAARQAGALLRERLGNIKNIDYKSAFNIVTDVDKASERLIIDTIKGRFPEDHILAEETGRHQGATKRRWLIDPLDGTTNFAHGYPFFCVSIGFEVDGEPELAVVYNPVSDELFSAQKGKGAYLNDRPMHVSSNQRLEQCLIATGFPPDTRTALISNMKEFNAITDLTHGVRRDGSAALDLSFVACGRLDGFWEAKLAPWDLAAGVLLVREAGGRVTNLTGGTFDINTGHVLATNALIHDELVQALAFSESMNTAASQR